MFNFILGLVLIWLGVCLLIIGANGLKYLWHQKYGTYYRPPGMVFNFKTGMVEPQGDYWVNLK